MTSASRPRRPAPASCSLGSTCTVQTPGRSCRPHSETPTPRPLLDDSHTRHRRHRHRSPIPPLPRVPVVPVPAPREEDMSRAKTKESTGVPIVRLLPDRLTRAREEALVLELLEGHGYLI